MRTYQVYTANDAGEIVCSPEVFLASDDVAAIERVQRSGRCVELWQGLSPREAMGESSRRTELSRQMTNAGAEAVKFGSFGWSPSLMKERLLHHDVAR